MMTQRHMPLTIIALAFALAAGIGCTSALAESTKSSTESRAVADNELADLIQASLNGQGPGYIGLNLRCQVSERCPRHLTLLRHIATMGSIVAEETPEAAQAAELFRAALAALPPSSDEPVCPCRPLIAHD